MARTLKVQLDMPNRSLVRRFREFAQEVYLSLPGECEMSLEEIKAATTEFHLRGIPDREVRVVAAKVRKITARYREHLPFIDVFEVPEFIQK